MWAIIFYRNMIRLIICVYTYIHTYTHTHLVYNASMITVIFIRAAMDTAMRRTPDWLCFYSPLV